MACACSGTDVSVEDTEGAQSAEGPDANGASETGAGEASESDAPEEARLAKVLTISDAVAAGRREDRGGPALVERLEAEGFKVVEHNVIADGAVDVASALRTMADTFTGVIVTTGGTGFGPRDLTPEGTRAAIDREAPGLAEAMRTVNPLGRLSRAVAGTIGTALVLNTPGSPKGAVECLDAVIDVLPHALDLLAGLKPH